MRGHYCCLLVFVSVTNSLLQYVHLKAVSKMYFTLYLISSYIAHLGLLYSFENDQQTCFWPCYFWKTACYVKTYGVTASHGTVLCSLGASY